MKLKPGASLKGVKDVMFIAAIAIENVMNALGYECTITSGTDSMDQHGGGDASKTLHDDGLALDFRSRYLTEDAKRLMAQEMQAALGPAYQVIIEKDHFHVEYQPTHAPHTV